MSAEAVRLRVGGMSCGHCVRAVTLAVKAVPGVETVEVDLEGGIAVVQGRSLDPTALAQAIEAEGFTTQPE